MARKCKLCGEREATVPDRDRPGRRTNEVCGTCHAARLAEDFKCLLAGTGRCPKCGGPMTHERLRGYRCLACD